MFYICGRVTASGLRKSLCLDRSQRLDFPSNERVLSAHRPTRCTPRLTRPEGVGEVWGPSVIGTLPGFPLWPLKGVDGAPSDATAGKSAPGMGGGLGYLSTARSARQPQPRR